MNLTELKTQLSVHPDFTVSILLPGGGRIPAHYHVTEVGHIAKKFVDCSGTFRANEVCLLQTHLGSPRDDGHRLTAGRLVKILGLAKPILPSDDLPVEVEYEAGVISQFPLVRTRVREGAVQLHLGHKHTACLAKEQCGGEEDGGCASETAGEAGACCAAPAGGKTCC